MDPATTKAITPYPTFDFQSKDDLGKELAPELSIRVQGIENNYQTINVADSMGKLTQVGNLIRLAYAGSKGRKCSVQITAITVDYQTLIKDSSVTCSSFVEASVAALKIHKFALILANKNQTVKAANLISTTAKLASKMSDLSQDLVMKCVKLCKLASDGLKSATEEEVATTEEKEATLKKMNELQARVDQLQRNSKDLTEAVAEAKEKEAQIEREARDAREKAFALNITSAVLGAVTQFAGAFIGSPSGAAFAGKSGAVMESLNATKGELETKRKDIEGEKSKINGEISTKESELIDRKGKLAELKADSPEMAQANSTIAVLEEEIRRLKSNLDDKQKALDQLVGPIDKVSSLLEKDANELQKKSDEISKQRSALQKELRDANAELVGSITSLKNSGENVNNLSASIKSLEIVVSTLGKITTIFENTRIFWVGIEKHCKALADVTLIQTAAEVADLDVELMLEFTNGIKDSGLSWFALGRINLTACIAMGKVNETIDSHMSNLPTKDEALVLVQTLSNQMLQDLEKDRQLIENN